MSGITVARMGLTRINEKELGVMFGIFSRHDLECRSRLRAIGSGKRPELDDGDAFRKILGKVDLSAVAHVHELSIRRFAPHTRPIVKRVKILHVSIEGKVHIVVDAPTKF